MLVECIQQLLQPNKRGAQNVRILATAPSNSAADLLAERMAAAPVSMSPSAMFRLNAISRDSRSIPVVLQPFCSIVGDQCILRPRVALLRYELVISTCNAAATLTRWAAGWATSPTSLSTKQAMRRSLRR